jgi:acetyltransferase-like isoleucine patch superfamily enzyme
MAFKKIRDYLLYNFLHKKIKPEIIGGFKNPDGKVRNKTRISNLTHISNKGNNLNIGENVFIGHFSYIDGHNAKVTICNNVQITNYVSILTHSSHNAIRLFGIEYFTSDKYPELYNVGEIYIGENTFIGPHTLIMPGSKIGKGCIVSAYSFINGEFPDFSIIRGIPAKVVGDTREIDSDFLKKYPELMETYYLKDGIN